MDQLAAAPPPVSAAFSGERGAFRRLVTRGALLELVTVGFYRFWLATDIRRHLWLHTSIDGDAFEYTGRAKELLLGFLFALAILVPVYLLYFLITTEAERLKAFASIPLVAFFYLFGQFAIFRARRYRLTRTVWRGVRFWMTGSGWAYAARAGLWALLMPLTLGLILPWREAALERYKMRHSHYGDLQGSFEGSGWDFFKRGWWLWLVFLILLIGLPSLWLAASGLMANKPSPALVGFATLATFVVPVVAPFIYAAFKAAEWRWWLSGIRFGEVCVDSKLPRGALIGLYWKVVGWYLLISTLFGVYLSGCAAVIGNVSHIPISKVMPAGNLQANFPMLALIVLGYLGLVLSLNVVMRVYLLRDVWAKLVQSLTIYDIDAAADVAARGEAVNALGEGFADGLDVAGF